jgi:hypothetical protein
MRGIEVLLEGRLDVVLGLASRAPAPVSAELIRREPLLVAMSTSHRLAEQDTGRRGPSLAIMSSLCLG